VVTGAREQIDYAVAVVALYDYLAIFGRAAHAALRL